MNHWHDGKWKVALAKCTTREAMLALRNEIDRAHQMSVKIGVKARETRKQTVSEGNHTWQALGT